MIEFSTNLEYLNKLTDYKITFNEFNKVLVYIQNKKIVAFLDYSVMYDRIEINYIYVIEEYRRNNIAFKLIDYVISNYDFYNITLEVSVLNNNAISLYKKLGFNVIGIREKYYNGVDAYLMERRNL